MNKEESKKLNLPMSLALAIGSIIGSGIFVYTGYAIGISGTAVPLAFILASIITLYLTLPSMQLSSAIPATGGTYMYVSRFVHPVTGYVQILNSLIGSLNIAVMSLAFANYFVALVDGVDIRIVGVLCAITLAAVGTFGVRISGRLQQIIVVVLLVALLVYVVSGFSKLNSEYLTFGDVFKPLGGLAGLWASIAIVRYTLQGGNIMMTMAGEMKNPSRDIPLSFFLGTLITAGVYALVAYVTLGTAPFEEIANTPLSDTAHYVLNGIWLKFFIVGGGMVAILTTLNGSFMIYSRIHWVAARDGIWPKVFTKINKYNVPYVTLWTATVISLVVISFNISLGRIFTYVAVPALLLSPIYQLQALLLPYKLPNCHKHAFFRMPKHVSTFVTITAAFISFWLGKSLFDRMESNDIYGIAIFLIVGFAYWIIRVRYLKSKGIDLVSTMKGYHPDWIAKEESYKNSSEETE